MSTSSILYKYGSTIINRRRVTWVHLLHPYDLYGIEKLGGPNWEETRQQVASHIDAGTYEYFTQVGLYEAKLVTFTMNGQNYVRTRPDTTVADNLLKLERR